MMDDAALLRRYAEERSEAAFAELVRRYVNQVYFAALRQVSGDAHRAEDVTQAVFTLLARKAASLAGRPTLAGWLYTTTRFVANETRRAERRRQVREQEAHAMQELAAESAPAADWDRLRPVIDDVMNELNQHDREAVLLRFFHGRPFAEIGAALRVTEDAARMRVDRALDKLRTLLARRGITSTSAALAVALANQAGMAAPAGLAASVTGAALAGTAASAGGWLTTFMSISKLQVGIAGALAVAGATVFWLQAKTNASLRREFAALRGQQQAVAALRAENQRLATVAAEVEMLRSDDLELKQLAQSAAEAKKSNEENARLARIRDNDRNVQAEIERMNREGNALVEEYKVLMEQSKEPSLTAEAKSNASAAAQQKLEAIKMKKSEINIFTQSARAAGWVSPPSAGTLELRRPVPSEDESTNPPTASGSLKFVPRP